MFNSLLIENFQPHKETKLEFHKGVNAIVGTSDSGKTAIIRALNLVINNQPAGDSYRRHETKETNVALELNDYKGVIIQRHKTKNESSYTFGREVFKSIGKGVPEKIEKALNLSNINMQSQMDKPFLLDDSAGEVARVLNKTINLNIIGTCQSNINKKLLALNRSLEADKNSKINYSKEIKQYEYIPDMESQISRLEFIEISKVSVEKDLSKLNNYIKQEEDVQKAITSYGDLTQIGVLISDLEEKGRRLKGYEDDKSELKDVIHDIANIQKELDKLIHINELDKKIIHLGKQEEFIQHYQIDINNLLKKIEEFIELDAKLKTIGEIMPSMQSEFDQLMPDQCPLCGKGN